MSTLFIGITFIKYSQNQKVRYMGAGQNLIVKPHVKITYKDPCGVADAGAMQNLYIIYPNNPAKTTNAITAGINQAR
jgi:hypothetical protein